MLKKCLAVAMTLVAQVAFAAIGDSTKFDQDKFERIGDTLYYKISTAEQFEKLLEGVRIETDGYVVGLIENDLVMGKDTVHLAKNNRHERTLHELVPQRAGPYDLRLEHV